jgi:glycosyltransferase involved in cell wall biosynthesis
MNNQKLKVLLIVEQCNPEAASVPLVGYKFFQAISKLTDVTLVTHERNKTPLSKLKEHPNITYIAESELTQKYFSLVVHSLTMKGKNNWPLANVLGYPVYAEFNHKVYESFKDKIQRGDYDLVHALTPMQPRYPFKVIKACAHTPVIIGPVNGGVPFPAGFEEIAKQEYAYLNFFRAVGRALIPGYVETYKKADKILAGSTYTLNILKDMFAIPDNRIELFYENGIASSFLTETKKVTKGSKINLLFVARLVPYKCADILIEAVSRLEPNVKEKVCLTIVGDGQERNSLETQVRELNLGEKVKFAGWVGQEETVEYYRQADIFCFPSIREFGGAVVMEAMACGLPCIVANNGGIGEYVNEETGFKIEPISREYLTQQLTSKIKMLVEDDKLRESMSAKAIERAKEFEWENKARKIVEIYGKMLGEKGVRGSAY